MVYRLDRLARDLILQETLLRELSALGAVFSTMPAEQDVITDDPEDPARRLVRQVLGAVAEYERALIRLRLRNGRRRKHERGGYAYGSPPLRTRAEAGELVTDEAEAATVARTRELRDGGASVRAIAATLAAEGHTPQARWPLASRDCPPGYRSRRVTRRKRDVVRQIGRLQKNVQDEVPSYVLTRRL